MHPLQGYNWQSPCRRPIGRTRGSPLSRKELKTYNGQWFDLYYNTLRHTCTHTHTHMHTYTHTRTDTHTHLHTDRHTHMHTHTHAHTHSLSHTHCTHTLHTHVCIQCMYIYMYCSFSAFFVFLPLPLCPYSQLSFVSPHTPVAIPALSYAHSYRCCQSCS